eukprot:TRINITY_DN7242_c0_g1_i1.p1 TRINITY_DN7242_c0_g1~~TRINITY_DN7242_c0_g1_i1.p1  ORF type:complete len:344 (+),score=69.91 TRINITY_DN7242_c0_g1_i1:108-1139(+)
MEETRQSALQSHQQLETQQPKQKIFELNTSFKDLHLPTFLAFSSAVYICENVVYYPFDVLRTRLQTTRGVNFSWGASFGLAKQLGVRGLYRGFLASSVGALPPHAVYFLSYNFCKDHLQSFHDKHYRRKSTRIEGKQALWVSFVAGGLADLIANFFVVPCEVVVQRLQIQDHNSPTSYKGGIDAVKTIFRQEGIKGFFNGFGATLLAYAPASAIWWASYEHSKAMFSDMLTKRDGSNVVVVSQHIPAQILAGATAGWITTILTNPMDVVKTRLQTQHYQVTAENQKLTLYANTWSAFKVMMKEEGWRAFTRGVGPKLLTTTIFSSWFGLAYEFILDFSKKDKT